MQICKKSTEEEEQQTREKNENQIMHGKRENC
jgi:hypothetical protein